MMCDDVMTIIVVVVLLVSKMSEMLGQDLVNILGKVWPQVNQYLEESLVKS